MNRLHAVFVAEGGETVGGGDGGSKVIGLVELCVTACPVPVQALGAQEDVWWGRKKGRDAAYICNLAVVDGYRGRGVGSLLIDYCEVQAREGGCSEIFLEAVGARHIPGRGVEGWGFLR